MQPRRRWLYAGGLAAALTLGVGCGGGGAPAASGTAEEATVKGKVTIQGKPATKGRVSFDPRNVNRKEASIQTVGIKPDGTYEAKTLVGRNSITVVDIPRPSKPGGGMVTEFGFDVQTGENTFDIPVGTPTP